jgi:hypothetical protein
MAASWIQDLQSIHEEYLAGQDYHQQSTRLLLANALKYAQRRSESWSNGINRIST